MGFWTLAVLAELVVSNDLPDLGYLADLDLFDLDDFEALADLDLFDLDDFKALADLDLFDLDDFKALACNEAWEARSRFFSCPPGLEESEGFSAEAHAAAMSKMESFIMRACLLSVVGAFATCRGSSRKNYEIMGSYSFSHGQASLKP